MRVFITWSGDRSKQIADHIRTWLPGVLQAVKPYFSPDDVAKGSRWFPEIANELEASQIGLLCITRENLHAPWLLFEAGALGKNLDKSKVCPLLFGVEPTDLTGPLAQFQGAPFTKSEFKQVVEMINEGLGDAALSPEVLSNVFDMWWPPLESQIDAVLRRPDESETNETARTERDMLEEVLGISRLLAQEGRRGPRDFNPTAIDDLLERYVRLLRTIQQLPNAPELKDGLRALFPPLRYVARRGGTDRRRIRQLLEEAEFLLTWPGPGLIHADASDESVEEERT